MRRIRTTELTYRRPGAAVAATAAIVRRSALVLPGHLVWSRSRRDCGNREAELEEDGGRGCGFAAVAATAAIVRRLPTMQTWPLTRSRSRRDCGNREAEGGLSANTGGNGAAVAATAAIVRRKQTAGLDRDKFGAAVAATAAIVRRFEPPAMLNPRT